MEYPVNYDFEANWRINVVPHLDNPLVRQALKDGINGYLTCFPRNEKYKHNTCYANYSSMDYYATLMMRKGEIYMKELEDENRLPRKYLNLKNSINEDNADEIGYLLLEMEDKIQRPLYKWENIKYDLETYVVCGASHFMAPTFGLTLARLVEPQEEWRIRAGKEHTTVINKNNTKVFDINYWFLDGRLENYMFGDDIKKHDPTLGGKEAYLKSR
jgi:hypothetical protein